MGLRDSVWLALALALGVACGRSGLAVPRGASGAGGQGGAGGTDDAATSTGPGPGTTNSTTSAATTGAGGQGGGGACTAFDFVAPVVGIAGGAGYRQMQPRFVQASPDSLTVVAEWRDAGGSGGPPPSELRHTTFFPWSSWPAGDVGPSYLADLEGGRSFGPSVPAGSIDGTFDVLFRGATGVTFMPSVIADSGFIPPSINVDPSDARILYASSLPDLSLFAYDRDVGQNVREIVLGSVVRAGPGAVAQNVTWCADGFAGGAAVPRPGGGFLVAQSFGTSGPCFSGAPEPTSLDLGVLDIGAGVPPSFQPTTTLDAPAPLRRLRATADGDAMWIVTEVEELEPILWLLRFDGTSGVLGPIGILQAGELGRGPVAISMLGSRILVAWIDDPPALDPVAYLALYDADGTLHARASAPTGGSTTGPIALATSPDGASAVLGWTLDLGGSEDRIQLLRVDCAN